MSRYMIVLESREYGAEKFTYDTRKEQREGWERLIKACRDGFLDDGVERHLLSDEDEAFIDADFCEQEATDHA